jgi:hypothetical protein
VHILNSRDAKEVACHTEVTGDLYIDPSGGGLPYFELPLLEFVGGGLYIRANSDLVGFDLPVLASVGSDVSLSGLWSLTDLDGLSGLESIGGSLTITGSEVLSSLDGLAALESIGENLSIRDNTGLTSISALAGINVGGDVTITNNTTLPTCAAEELVASLVGFDGAVEITGNDDTGVCE